MPEFGFKAKPVRVLKRFTLKCSMPEFGFKAKPRPPFLTRNIKCSMPEFGFKAKLSHDMEALAEV